ncbi:spindle assembly checkpoint component mad1 [Diplodia corticola]|uniref:Spindle assembly checkpoint component MAD1 n=1 Tax=Diplodia corticola TaxID=236234 RepID=A0A1J9RJE1_9PEZI|nr:spindle assembly checkpoint component mad1 [Diplodia corticola]OJD32683.1 spindle assembly checkpoint component mad1 [Diplodia corticola]
MARNTNQPTFNFFTGETGEPEPAHAPTQSFRQTLRQSVVKPDIGNEDLRAQINTLQYELESLRQEREMSTLSHQAELRDAQNRAEAEYQRAQAAESASKAAAKKYEALQRETGEAASRSTNEKLELERKVRALQERGASLQEEADEATHELAAQERQSRHRYDELDARHGALQRSFDELRAELEGQAAALQQASHKLARREVEAAEAESELIRLRAQAGDHDTLHVVKRELSEQIAHIRKLEAVNREQAAELKRLGRVQKSVEVVEEEKRALENRVRMMEDLRRELSEEQLKRQLLEDEKSAWTNYLDGQAAQADGEGELRFGTPEDLAKAFVRERLETATMVDRLGAVQAELTARDETIKALEDEKARVREELEKLKSAGGASDSKLRMRLERQRALAVKEVEYLRAQLKAFDAEESEFQPETFDAHKTQRIQQLEDAVDGYRAETQALHAELSALEESNTKQITIVGSKRPRDADDDARMGELRRKNRQLQDDLGRLLTEKKVLEAERRAHEKQIRALNESSRTRVLELRQNPTADAEALKLSTVRTLREENKALLARLEAEAKQQLADDADDAVVPRASLEAARLEMAELHRAIADRDKKTLRLKQLWSAKALEFREAVASLLGWKLDIMPNGRVKVTSLFYPGGGGGDDDGGCENSIVFDGERGTMKVSGGEKSVFASEIRGQIEFWVEQRKEIPCFLAQLTLDFWESTTRAVGGGGGGGGA